MRIIFLRSNPVDPDPRVEKEVNALLKAGHSIKIIAWDRCSKYKIKKKTLSFQNGYVDIYRFGIPATFGGGIKKNLLPLLEFQLRIYQLLKKNLDNFDAIHACDFDTAFISSRIAFKYKKKFIYDIYDFYVDAFDVPSILKPIVKNADQAIINNTDAVIICNDDRKEQIVGTDPKKLIVIHNTPPSHYMSNFRSLNLNKNKLKIVYVGILDQRRLIRETAEIVKDNLNYEYHIAGFGQLAQLLEEMSAEYDNIFFYGKISYNHALELEHNCDIMTALYDPKNRNHRYAAPNKFYEALMLGKPLIMVKNTGMDAIVEKNKIGVVINYSKEDLKRGIKVLVDIKQHWGEISRNMKRIYSENYSWIEMEKRLIDLYSKI